jgi:uncharacterized membrane protein YqiK
MRLRSRPAQPKPSVDESLAASVASRVEEIVAAAEQTAARLQNEIERTARAEAANIRAAAQADAARLRTDAEAAANRLLADSRQQIEAWTKERLAEIESLIDVLTAQAVTVQRQAEAADEIRRHLNELISAVGDAADHLAARTAERADARSSEARPMLPTTPHR